ncbi:MAG TPA: hypothetical protein VK841_09490 [Polyangiaceae bacterium]|nr:hypothetical protein [Polyangiaceae bacterium]
MTDGLVPKRYAETLWGDRKNKVRLVEMVHHQLLGERDGFYEVLRYAPRNQTKAMVEEARKNARERMSKLRASRSANVRANFGRSSGEVPKTSHDQISDVPISISSLSPVSSLQGDPERESGVLSTGDGPERESGVWPPARAGGPELVQAWCDGLSEHRGTTYPMPWGKPLLAVTEALERETRRLGHTSAMESFAWAKALGGEYSAACAGREVSTLRFPEWLGSGRPRAVAKAAVQPAISEPTWKQAVPNE